MEWPIVCMNITEKKEEANKLSWFSFVLFICKWTKKNTERNQKKETEFILLVLVSDEYGGVLGCVHVSVFYVRVCLCVFVWFCVIGFRLLTNARLDSIWFNLIRWCVCLCTYNFVSLCSILYRYTGEKK